MSDEPSSDVLASAESRSATMKRFRESVEFNPPIDLSEPMPADDGSDEDER